MKSKGGDEMETDPSLRFSNKRRIEGGSVGAPTPKIKRKRVLISDSKSQLLHNANLHNDESEKDPIVTRELDAQQVSSDVTLNSDCNSQSLLLNIPSATEIDSHSHTQTRDNYPSSYNESISRLTPYRGSHSTEIPLNILGLETRISTNFRNSNEEFSEQSTSIFNQIECLSKCETTNSNQSQISEEKNVSNICDTANDISSRLSVEDDNNESLSISNFSKKPDSSDFRQYQTELTTNTDHETGDSIPNSVALFEGALPQDTQPFSNCRFQLEETEQSSCYDLSVPDNNASLSKLNEINKVTDISDTLTKEQGIYSYFSNEDKFLSAAYLNSSKISGSTSNNEAAVDKDLNVLPEKNESCHAIHSSYGIEESINEFANYEESNRISNSIQFPSSPNNEVSSENPSIVKCPSTHPDADHSSPIQLSGELKPRISADSFDLTGCNTDHPSIYTEDSSNDVRKTTNMSSSPNYLNSTSEYFNESNVDLENANNNATKFKSDVSKDLCSSDSNSENVDNVTTCTESSLTNNMPICKLSECNPDTSDITTLSVSDLQENFYNESIKPCEAVSDFSKKISVGDDDIDNNFERSKEKRERTSIDGQYSSDDGAASESDSLKPPIRRRTGAVTGLSAKPKVKNLRRNIREIISDDKLEENTLAAQKEEQLRLQRLQEKRVALREYMEQQQEERLVAEVAEAAEAVTVAEAIEEVEAAEMAEQVPESMESENKAKRDDSDIVVLSSEEDGNRIKEESDLESSDEDDGMVESIKKEVKSEQEESMDDSDQKSKDSSESDSDSDVVVLSHSDDEDDSEDVTNSGAHINDEFNVPDAQGRVLVNVGHPEKEVDIFLAPQLAQVVKPHQIGGIRFLYDNIVESLEQFKTSNGFGCILAHSMGLGKTLQVIALTDVFLRHTGAKTVLIIVPINTIQNWQAEYNQWLSDERPQGLPEEVDFQLRTFKVFILNDSQKNIQSRAKVIRRWHEEGGVLLMGYELYRQLSLKKPKKPKKKKKNIKKVEENSEIVDIEEEDKNKELLDEIQKALVRPGPDLIICDEGHRIKNAHANISQALKSIQTRRRVVLTGYPLQNNLLEYWCMVDFIRPNYLGTKTEFCNMFERPIQNGQCVDSTPQDVKIMRYRSHVLHSLLEGFVQRRGHSVLAKTLPSKQEHVLLCRMTKIQRTLYSAYMAELNSSNKSVANPLKAFAICCKIWNHPDVLYNFVMKRMNEDCDLELDDIVNKNGKSKKPGMENLQKMQETNLPNPSCWDPNNQQMHGTSGLQPQISNSSTLANMGMSNHPHQQGNIAPSSSLMHSGIGHPNMGQNQDENTQHQNMSMGRNGAGHPTMNMNYGMGMYNMQQNYNMHQMPPPYPWSYNQGYPPNHSDSNNQHYPPPSPYGAQYPPQYSQSHPMQQHNQHQLPMAHLQQTLPPSQNLPGYPHPMLSSPHLGIGPPPAHPSLHQHGHLMNAAQQNSQSMHDQKVSDIQQQNALNLSHQANNSNMLAQTSHEMQSHQNLLNQNDALSKQQNLNLHNRNNANLAEQSINNQAYPHHFSQQSNLNNSSSMNSDYQPENLSIHHPDNPYNVNGDHLTNLLNQNMKDLGINDHTIKGNVMDQRVNNMPPKEGEMQDTKDPNLLLQSYAKTPDSNPGMEQYDILYKQEDVIKKENDICSKTDNEKLDEKKTLPLGDDNKNEEEEEKEVKKEDVKSNEQSFEWAENILKDYVPGKLENSTKFQIFFRILEGSLKVGDRLLVFSQSLFTLSQLEENLQRTLIPNTGEVWAKNRSYFRLDGSTSAQEREKLIKEFNSNTSVYLFLVSTRAGSLGINLVGANRVIVFDASFNPCHDTQAVCRVYRYGQQKPCHIYRLVTDNSLERRIYDRQVNKQGISDRIVDEMNPDAHLSSKEIGNLLVADEEDPEPEDIEDKGDTVEDKILKQIIREKSIMFTRMPFQHESLLVDRKDKKLSNAEKRLAKRSYELEKQANISYSRPYSSFYPKTTGAAAVMMGSKIGGIVYAKPVGTVRPMQSEMGHKIEGGGTMMHRPNILSRSGGSNYPVENLAKQGVSVQQITVPKDVSIPTNSGDGKPIQLKSGQSVMVIKTQKGMYLRLSDGKIVAIRVPPEEAFGMPLNQGSVTIVPTMINSQRSRTMVGGRGGIVPTRRGRPPMSAQYALGQVVPKGTPKGQMAVRILRKPVVSSRGAKTFQTIAVPVSSSAQAALLNKSVVITPAKQGAVQSKFLKDLKISPKVQITPVPNKNRSSLSSIAGTSGLTKRLNRNNRIITAQALALKNEEEKQLKKFQLPVSEIPEGIPINEQQHKIENQNKAFENKFQQNDINLSLISQKQTSSPMEAATDESDVPNLSSSKEATSENSTSFRNESNIMVDSPKNYDMSNLSNTSEESESLSYKSSVNVRDQLPQSMRDITSAQSPLEPSKDSYADSPPHIRPISLVTPSEPITGIVKPMPHDNSGKLNPRPIQGLDNLIPSVEDGPGPPSTVEAYSTAKVPSVTAASSLYSTQSSFSSQPLFQPFLQQTMIQNSSSINSVTTVGSPAFSETCVPNWSKNSGSHGNRSASNVALVAPQVHSAAADLTSQSSAFLSPNNIPYTTASQSPIHGLQALTTSHLQAPSLPFSSLTDTPLLSSQQMDSKTPVSTPSGVTISSSLSGSNIQGEGRSSLSLSNLLSSPPYSQSASEDILTHSSPALDYLNYSLTASSSAFRRPEFPSALPSEIQNLLSPTSSSQVSVSPHSASVSSPNTYTTQTSPYSQYATPYRSQTVTSSGFRTPPSMASTYSPYPGQYGAYAGQYPNIGGHPVASPQPPTMGQYGSLQSPTNPYQGYPPPPPPSGPGIPPYSSSLSGFGHSSYPPM